MLFATHLSHDNKQLKKQATRGAVCQVLSGGLATIALLQERSVGLLTGTADSQVVTFVTRLVQQPLGQWTTPLGFQSELFLFLENHPYLGISLGFGSWERIKNPGKLTPTRKGQLVRALQKVLLSHWLLFLRSSERWRFPSVYHPCLASLDQNAGSQTNHCLPKSPGRKSSMGSVFNMAYPHSCALIVSQWLGFVMWIKFHA